MSGRAAPTVGQLAAHLKAQVVPPEGVSAESASALAITGFAGLSEAGPNDLSFLSNPKYQPQLATTKAGAVLIAKADPSCAAVQLVTGSPDWALGRLAQDFGPKPSRPAAGIHPTAVIGEGTVVAPGARVGAYAVIGAGCQIGANAIIHAQVVLGDEVVVGEASELFPQSSVRERCRLGARVVLHNGAVIGSDGFGYASIDGVHHKIPQVGIVIVEDDVEVGANTTIDRARFGTTRIGAGTKIDNLVQIGHNVQIGRGSIIVAQAGIAGSTRLGEHNVVGGQAGLAGHLTLGDRVQVSGRAGVSKDFPAGTVLRGYPAQEYTAQQRLEVSLRRLPQTQAQVRDLEARLAELERRLAAKG